MRAENSELQGLLNAWFAGWSSLRSYPTAVVHGAPAAMRNDRKNGWEYFLAEPSAEQFSAVAKAANEEDNRALCVLAQDTHHVVRLAHRSRLGMISTSERFMSVLIEAQDLQGPFFNDPSILLEIRHMGGRRVASDSTARLVASVFVDGAVAASGRVAVHGEFAVFDQIETAVEFRRQGYGRAVLQALSAKVQEFQVTTGLVVASTDGERLYSKLGWRVEAPVTILAPLAALKKLAERL